MTVSVFDNIPLRPKEHYALHKHPLSHYLLTRPGYLILKRKAKHLPLLFVRITLNRYLKFILSIPSLAIAKTMC